METREDNGSEHVRMAAAFYDEVINNKKTESIGEFLTEDFTHNGESRGVEGQKQAVEMFLNAFEGLTNTQLIIFGSGNMVCVHSGWKGKHTGSFMNVEATGKDVSWTSTAILKFRGEKICEAWDENDFLSLFRQIGRFPKV